MLFLFFLFAEKALAAGEGYELLAYIPTIPTKTQPTLVVYMKGLFTAAVGIAIVLAVIMIILGGIQYVLAAVPSSKEDGKKKIMGALQGLLLVLISAIFLNTINPALLRVGLNLSKTTFDAPSTPPGQNTPTKVYCKTILTIGNPVYTCFSTYSECKAQQSAVPFVDCDERWATKPITDGVPVEFMPPSYNPPPPSGTGTPQSDAVNRKILTDAGVTFNPVVAGRVVSVEGMRDTTVSAVVNLKTGCPSCDIKIASGTDGSHAVGTYSHANGYKVDLQQNAGTNAYIQSIATDTGRIRSTDGARLYQGSDGVEYWKENTIWDLVVK
ncbi:MAG: pilin [Candidatus Paceibacterota bacterium]